MVWFFPKNQIIYSLWHYMVHLLVNNCLVLAPNIRSIAINFILDEIKLLQNYVFTWHKINVWNKEDMCRTEVLGWSENPAIITWIWSAIWQEASWGIGWHKLLFEPIPCNALCVNEPKINQDKRRIWLMHSRNSLDLKRIKLELKFL